MVTSRRSLRRAGARGMPPNLAITPLMRMPDIQRAPIRLLAEQALAEGSRARTLRQPLFHELELCCYSLVT